MSEVPNNWSVKTPSLSGRRTPWGAPKPILIGCAALGILAFFYFKPIIGTFFSIPLSLALVLVPIGFCAKATRKDRDWFYLLVEVIVLRFRYMRYTFWRWKNDI